METAAQAVLAYVNSQIGKSEYNGMALREAFSAIIENADENTRKGWMSSVTLKEGYFILCQLCFVWKRHIGLTYSIRERRR